jgi:hypothetical protein
VRSSSLGEILRVRLAERERQRGRCLIPPVVEEALRINERLMIGLKPGQHHHDADHHTERAVFTAGDDDAGDFAFDRATAGGAVLFVKRVESLDDPLHQTRTAAPPDRRAKEHDVGGFDLCHQVRPVVVPGFAKPQADRSISSERRITSSLI